MRYALLVPALACSVLLAVPDTATADIKTRHKNQVKFEGMLGRMMGMFGGDAAKDGLITTTVVVGNKMMTRSDARKRMIVDLDARENRDVDDEEKTFEVTTFEELQQRMQEMRERARQQAPPDAGGGPPPADGQQAPEWEVDMEVRRPGDTRTINNNETELTVTIISVHQKDRSIEEYGGIVITGNTWATDADIGTKEVLEFQRRYALELNEILGFDSSADQMSSAMGMFPGLGEAIKKFQEAGVDMTGTAILTEMTVENVRGTAQMTQAQPEEEPKPRGRFGGLGGLGSRIGRAIGGDGNGGASGEPRSTIFTATTELLEVDPNPDASEVEISSDYREK